MISRLLVLSKSIGHDVREVLREYAQEHMDEALFSNQMKITVRTLVSMKESN